MLIYVATRALPPAINYLANDDNTCATAITIDGYLEPDAGDHGFSILTYTATPANRSMKIRSVVTAESGEPLIPDLSYLPSAPMLTYTMKHNEDIGRKVNSAKEISSAVSQVMINFIVNKTMDSSYVEANSTILKTAISGDVGLADGTYIDDIHLVLEVQRHKVFNFKLPPGILKGATKLNGVKIEGSNLRVEMQDYGKKVLYTDCGDITILCVPGFRLSK